MLQIRLPPQALAAVTYSPTIFNPDNQTCDLKTRKSTTTSCQIEIHFFSQTSKFLIKYNLLRFQISGGLIIFFTKHDY